MKRRSKRRYYRIGEWVWVTKTAELGYDDKQNRILTKNPVDWNGQICGLVRRRTGRVETDTYCYSYQSLDPPEPYSCLVDIKVHYFWEVRRGLTNAPFLVAEEDMALIEDEEAKELELPYVYRKDTATLHEKAKIVLKDYLRKKGDEALNIR